LHHPPVLTPFPTRRSSDLEAYHALNSPLAIALGKDIAGNPVVADLARMPHLLVAGTTGSGKSVALNAMILALLYKAEPRAIRLIDRKSTRLNSSHVAISYA